MAHSLEVLQVSTEPLIAVVDRGEKIQHPQRHVDEVGDELFPPDGPYVTYRDLGLVAFISSDAVPKRFDIDGQLVIPSTESFGVTTGVDYYGDIWGELPHNVFSESKSAWFDKTTLERGVHYTVPTEVAEAEISDPIAAGRTFLDASLRDKPYGPHLLIGTAAITDFIEGMIDVSEAGENKSLFLDGFHHILPKADWDILHTAVMAFLAGIPVEKLRLPEEHKYRVLVNVASKFAWYHAEHKNGLDAMLEKPEGMDDRGWEKMKEMSHPLWNTQRIYSELNVSLQYLAKVYQFTPKELVETAWRIWRAQQYWFNGSSEVEEIGPDLKNYLDTPYRDEWADLFDQIHSSDRLQHYYDAVKLSVLTTFIPDYFDGDAPKVMPKPPMAFANRAEADRN